MYMSKGVVSKGIDRKQKAPVEPFSKASIKDLKVIYFYTSVFAPLGVRERLWHVWKRDGVVIQKVPLEITGGRKEGYRTWSKKTLSEGMEGRWTVDIMTNGEQLIGRVRFNITP